MYWLAVAGSTQGANTCSKNSTASAAIVKGLMSQLTTSVNARPRGLRPTARTDAKSICTIIGTIITQMNTATTRLTCANSSAAMAAKRPGDSSPSTTPAAMPRPTQTVR